MSEVIPSGKDGAISDQPEKKDSVSYETYSKLLGEKKKEQAEKAELKAQLEEKNQAELELQGKYKEALENMKTVAKQEKEKGINLFKKVSEKAVKSQFKVEAEKLGCLNPEDAFKLCDVSDLELTEDLEFDVQKLREKIQGLTKEKSYLFKKDFKLPADHTPSNTKLPEKSLKDMTPQELLNEYQKLST